MRTPGVTRSLALNLLIGQRDKFVGRHHRRPISGGNGVIMGTIHPFSVFVSTRFLPDNRDMA